MFKEFLGFLGGFPVEYVSYENVQKAVILET